MKKSSSSSSDRPRFWPLLRRRERDAVAQSEEGSETEESAKVEESAKPEEGAATAPSLKFHGQFIPPVDQVIYERYFGHSLLRGTYLECGAFDGVVESSCLFFAETMGWRAINLEASPPIFRKLCQNRPDALNIHAALSDSDGSISFTHAIHPRLGQDFGNGSVAHSEAHRAELDSLGCDYETFVVPRRSYRSLIEEHGIRSLDLMVLDVEGHELAAIDGMRGSAVLPTVLCIEFGHVGLQHLTQIMAEVGYTFDTTSHANAFFLRTDKQAPTGRVRSAAPVHLPG